LDRYFLFSVMHTAWIYEEFNVNFI
jgi:hypothetical protein